MSLVIETWELARQRHTCEEDLANNTLFRLLDLEPRIKTVFGFRPEQDVKNNPMLRMGILVHGKAMIAMIDSVLSLLGPDIEVLEDLLSQLGVRHTRLGVEKEYFPLLGQALFSVLKDALGEKYTKEVEHAWNTVYASLSDEIIKGM